MENEKRVRYNGLLPTDGGITFLVGFIFVFILSYILVGAVSVENTRNIIYSFVSQTIFMVVTIICTNRACRRDMGKLDKLNLPDTFHALGFNRRTKIGLLLLCVALSIFSIFAFLPISTLVEYLFGLTGFKYEPAYLDYTSNTGFIIGIFALCLFPAFGEEMFMRGCLMRSLRAKGTIFAIVVSSLMFALLHGSPTQFIHQFLIGVIMAYIVSLTGSLWHSIIFHFTNNFAVILFEFIMAKTGTPFNIPSWSFVIMGIGGIIVVAFLLIAFTYIVVKGANFKERVKEEINYNGKVKGTLKALFDLSDYGYKTYDKTPCVALYLAFGAVFALWLINTVLGWL